ncbi:hypothetical protein LIPSTDRAFT_335786 [Lipomyces starkeyi NRRL Y-11557]|uniref:DDE-1 domain-containing protein n=1 Tax=Lipomyces starkeyi NRRL Y-11557 TaxID=675824 RepID=A0A1E3PVE5_LIPST|nr:hypothetical protein LIPSTDRAFT_335786 [Lipomyces starkeyi NRRL Y-11557]
MSINGQRQRIPRLLRNGSISYVIPFRRMVVARDEIYNFDETRFQISVIGTSNIVTSAEREGSAFAFLKQPGNREWVIVVEAFNSSGWNVPPMVIFLGKVFQTPWFSDILHDWSRAVSSNGWITNELGHQWL